MPARRLVAGASLCLVLASCAHAAETPPSPRDPAAPAPDRCDDIATCEASCKHGRTESCVDAAKRMARSPVEANVARLVDVLGRACEGGRAASCGRLAQVLESSPSLAPDEARERSLHARACALGDAASCLALASLVTWKPGQALAPEDAARVAEARTLLEAGCEAGKGKSCAILAAMYLGLGITPDPAKSASLGRRAADALEASCLGGDAEDCALGVLQIAGAPGGGDPARLQRLLDWGCQLGSAEVCLELAKRATTAPTANRAALFKLACDAGREDGCFALAEIQRQSASATVARGLAGSLTLEAGVRLARAHCDLGETRGCDALAGALAREAIPAAEAARTADYLEKACDKGALLTCDALGEAMLRGPEALRDPARGARLKKKACDLGYPFACPDPMAKLRGG